MEVLLDGSGCDRLCYSGSQGAVRVMTHAHLYDGSVAHGIVGVVKVATSYIREVES